MTNINILIYLFAGVFGFVGLVLGIATRTMHNVLAGLCLVALAVAGVVVTRKEHTV